MDDAINHLKMAAEDYRWLTTPNRATITERAARENERLANQFDLAAEALRQMHNRMFEEGIVAGVQSLVDSCNARRLRKASPASAPEGFKHDIGADRFTVVQGSYWWHVRAGVGTKNIGKFHTKLSAEDMALTLLTAFRDGAFMQYQAMLAAAPTPPVSEGVDPVMTKEELIAAAESIGMRFTGASIAPAEDRKDAERYNKLVAYLVSDCTDFDDAIIAARTRDEMNTVIDTMQEDKP